MFFSRLRGFSNLQEATRMQHSVGRDLADAKQPMS